MNQYDDERAEAGRLLPAPAEPRLSADRHQLLRGHLMSEISEQQANAKGRGRSRLGWVALPALAGGLALALVLSNGEGATAPQRNTVAAPASGSAAQLNAAPVSAVKLLNEAADAAERKVPVDVKDKQFTYVKSVVAFSGINAATGEVSRAQIHNREIWLSVDGSQWGVLLEEGSKAAEAAKAAGKKRPGEPEPRTDGGIWLEPLGKGASYPGTYGYAASLPTDPDALLAKIKKDRAGQGQNPDQEAFVTIGDILREQIVSPKVSAALYRAAAKIPGVDLVKESVDASGRRGIAVARVEGNGVRTEWIFDVTSFDYLGERQVVVKDGELGKAGDVVGQAAVVSRGVTDKAGERP